MRPHEPSGGVTNSRSRPCSTRAGVDDEDERAAISGARCVECGTMLLVEAGYVPYSPAGVLVCAGCIEETGGTSDGPGAIVRDWTGR